VAAGKKRNRGEKKNWPESHTEERERGSLGIALWGKKAWESGGRTWAGKGVGGKFNGVWVEQLRDMGKGRKQGFGVQMWLAGKGDDEGRGQTARQVIRVWVEQIKKEQLKKTEKGPGLICLGNLSTKEQKKKTGKTGMDLARKVVKTLLGTVLAQTSGAGGENGVCMEVRKPAQEPLCYIRLSPKKKKPREKVPEGIANCESKPGKKGRKDFDGLIESGDGSAHSNDSVVTGGDGKPGNVVNRGCLCGGNCHPTERAGAGKRGGGGG